MRIKRFHKWPETIEDAIAIQNTLREKVRTEISEVTLENLRLVAGADVSSSKKDDNIYAGVILFSYPSLSIIEESVISGKTRFPYIPGLLSFREGPVLIDAFKGLTRMPELAIFDGQGIAHPAGLGLATHLGLMLDIPSIGCAKNRLIGEYKDPSPRQGSFSPLIYKGIEVGAVLRTKDHVRPVFVSPGHKMDIRESVRIVLALSKGYRLPEVIRQSHILVNRLRSEE
ncbi:MAG: deoxyribonuclease V [Nitrospirota bacterium]